jgi:hypothetical protein
MRAFMDAGERLEHATDPRELVAVGGALERTRYELACTRALLDGGDIPERSAPCLFDPAHGPSADEVRWAPDGGEKRRVPACALDAQRLAAGEHPRVRLIELGGRAAYYWDDPRLYGPLLEGYHDDFGGVRALAALLRDTVLGEALASAADRG